MEDLEQKPSFLNFRHWLQLDQINFLLSFSFYYINKFNRGANVQNVYA